MLICRSRHFTAANNVLSTKFCSNILWIQNITIAHLQLEILHQSVVLLFVKYHKKTVYILDKFTKLWLCRRGKSLQTYKLLLLPISADIWNLPIWKCPIPATPANQEKTIPWFGPWLMCEGCKLCKLALFWCYISTQQSTK